MATIKQKKAFNKIVENRGNVSKTMLEVGYDENTAKNPKNLTESDGWKELTKTIKDKEILVKWETLALDIDNVKQDRRLALDAGKEIMKINNRYPKEGNTTAIQINFKEAREEFE